jgi:hypothetical protein
VAAPGDVRGSGTGATTTGRAGVAPAEELRPRPAALAALTAAVTLLGAVGALPRWQGLVHLVALPPLDLIADLQLLLVRATGTPTFVVGLVVALVLRSAILAWLLGGLTRPRFWFALRFYLVVLPLAVVAAALFYGAQAVLFYGLFWAGLAVTLVLLVLTAALPWLGPPRLGASLAQAWRVGFRAGTVGCYLALLTAAGALADLGGPVATVVLVPFSGALTYATAWALRADPGAATARRAVAAVPAAALVAVVVVVMTGPAGPPRAEADDARDGSIMLMSGIDSSSGSGAILEVDPAFMGWTCDQTFYFSYAGPGEGQPQNEALCPIDHGAPYGPEDTLRSREELVPYLEAQAGEMTPPGVVAGHSQGAWLVWEAAAADRLPGVETVVLVGPFPENRVAYPAWDEGGAGAFGRIVLELIEVMPRPGGTTVFEADSPLGREWLGHADAVEEVLARPLPEGVRALSLTSSFDLPLVQGHHAVEGAVDACPVPVTHPNLPYAEEFQQVIVAFVEGRELPGCPWWRDLPGPLLRHFGAPPSPGQ